MRWSDAQWGSFAVRVCDRRLGVGADGVLVIEPSTREGVLAKMRVINSDGTDGGMCGNGIRCVAHMLLVRHNAGSQATIEAGGGLKRVAIAGRATANKAMVQVAMGSARVKALAVPVASLLPDLAAEIAIACGQGVVASIVDVGNPHLVLRAEKLPGHNALSVLGSRIEKHAAFPHRTNVQFAVVDADGVHVRTWERGSGITQACGTGACAVALSLAQAGHESERTIALPGGELVIRVTGVQPWENGLSASEVQMTGPAEWVFDGAVPCDAP